MGYACPVCEAPQADGKHLADHLAITAAMRGGDHEEWLDEHAPDWESSGPEELAERVVEAVPETEFPQVFEDTASDHQHQHGHGHDHGAGRPNQGLPFEQELARQTGGRGPGRGDLTGEAQSVIAEAQELTRQMLDEDADEGSDDGEAAGAADSEDEESGDGDEPAAGNGNE